MGYGLWPYCIDLDELASLPRPGTPALAALTRKAKARFEDLSEQFADEIAAGECAPPAETLAAIAAGKLKPRDAMHGRVIEAVVASLGKPLGNDIWEKFSSKFFSDLDDELTARGLKGKNAMVKIVTSGVPVMGKLVREPECGAMLPAQLGVVGGLIDGMDLSKLSALQREGAAEWRGWMKACERKGQSLVIFGG